MKRPSVWTDERNKLMQVSTSRLPDFDDLLLRLNALPGVPISSAAAVKTRWYTMLKTGRRRGEWTPLRVKMLLDLTAVGQPLREILEQINQLDGCPIRSTNAIESKLERLKGPRSVPCNRENASRVASENPPSVEPQPAVDLCDEVQEGFLLVTYESAKRWARGAGLLGKYAALNLKLANAVRRKSGLPQFVIQGAL